MTMRPSLLLFVLAIPAVAFQEPALYPVMRNLKTGFIDREGKIVIEPQFDANIDTVRGVVFSENLQPVAKDGKWGYIDRSGAVRIPFRFSLAQQFSEGLAAVQLETVRNGQHVVKYGYIDHSGAFKIPATFDSAQPFSEGLACVGRNYKFGFIDKSGSLVIDLRFDAMSAEGSAFSEGLAGAYQKGTADPQRKALAGQDGLWGYINKTGSWIVSPRYTTISPFHDGLAAVSQEGENGFKYIDPSGQKVLGPFAMAWGFSEGLARVQLTDGGGAFINREGKVQFTLDPVFHFVYPFSDGMAKALTWARPHGYEKVGYIDRTGKTVIPQIYQSGTPFHDGIAAVSLCGQSGYIGKNGEPVWGIKTRPGTASSPVAPSPSALTPEMIQRFADHPQPLTLTIVPGSDTCDPDGKKIWSVTVSSTDKDFPDLTINLLEGGTFLTPERLDNLHAIRDQFKDLKAPQSIAQPIGPGSNPTGYAMILGFGPGGSAVAASVFSPDRDYEVQVVLLQGASARAIKDPFSFTSKIAQSILSTLFSRAQ